MKITPCYRYGLDQVPEVGDGTLYHYTKFDSFLKILDSMTLRSSPLSKMNDLNEADLSGIDWSKEFLVMYNAQKYIRTQCSVISFSQNYEVESICREGANNPAMWAYYAENSGGVCIVLDRDALIENNHDSLKDVFYVLEDVVTIILIWRCYQEIIQLHQILFIKTIKRFSLRRILFGRMKVRFDF